MPQLTIRSGVIRAAPAFAFGIEADAGARGFSGRELERLRRLAHGRIKWLSPNSCHR
jgi:hypothetical protein